MSFLINKALPRKQDLCHIVQCLFLKKCYNPVNPVSNEGESGLELVVS